MGRSFPPTATDVPASLIAPRSRILHWRHPPFTGVFRKPKPNFGEFQFHDVRSMKKGWSPDMEPRPVFSYESSPNRGLRRCRVVFSYFSEPQAAPGW